MFHQSLETMLRAYCFENGKGVSLALFAVREVVQESLGFSPSSATQCVDHESLLKET